MPKLTTTKREAKMPKLRKVWLDTFKFFAADEGHQAKRHGIADKVRIIFIESSGDLIEGKDIPDRVCHVYISLSTAREMVKVLTRRLDLTRL